ncbi:immunity protein Imm33 domain-containing protein [Chitinimonas lacunae]|uniref:DUF2185 domain-containing protein n=1 Tax=Chitinimonas lacunae TaxID=1963018 RepID=A0ABV8MTS8_9NEIS
MPSWFLEDATAIAADYPYTFYKPSSQVISKVAVGEVVKLIFRFDSDDPEAPGAERMWVLVESVDGQGGFSGRLDNQPRYIKDLQPGDPIAFRDIHIINTDHDDHDNVVNHYLLRCYVTKRVLQDGARVGYLYREAPEQDNDSGWRIMAGDESQAYMDDDQNVAYVSLGAVLNRDDAFVDLLEAEIGAEFERHEDRFVRL